MERLIRYIFLSAIVSGISYSYFFQTQLPEFRVVSFVALLLFYIFLIQYFSIKIRQPKKVKKRNVPFSLYMISVVFILFFTFYAGSLNLITLFFHPFSFPAFFLGILIYFISEKSISYLFLISEKLFWTIPILTMVDIIFFNYPISLSALYCFLFFNYIITSKRTQKTLSIIYLITAIPILVIYDNRTAAIIIVLFILGMFSINIFKYLRQKVLRFLLLTASVGVAALIFFYFNETFEYFTGSVSTKVINTTDTRSFLFLEFFSDFDNSDFILGRGYLGTYYSDYFENWTGAAGDHSNRFSIEIGFLQIFLKGGIVLIFSILILFIVSIYRGFVQSSPASIKFKFSIWLLIEFCILTLENIPSFSVHYLFIWVIIGYLNLGPSFVSKKPLFIPI